MYVDFNQRHDETVEKDSERIMLIPAVDGHLPDGADKSKLKTLETKKKSGESRETTASTKPSQQLDAATPHQLDAPTSHITAARRNASECQ